MRIVGQVALAYLTLLFLGATWRLLPLAAAAPDLVALFSVYLGLTARHRLAPSVAGALIIGYLADLLMGSPHGLQSLVAGIVCGAGHLIQGRLMVRGILYTMVVSALSALFSGVLVLAVRAYAGLLPMGAGAGVGPIAKGVLLTALLGPLVFRACRQVDARFARTHRERDAAATGLLP